LSKLFSTAPKKLYCDSDMIRVLIFQMQVCVQLLVEIAGTITRTAINYSFRACSFSCRGGPGKETIRQVLQV
jgi:hypothetical protein